MTHAPTAGVPVRLRVATLGAVVFGVTIAVAIAVSLPLDDLSDLEVIARAAAFYLWIVAILVIPPFLVMLVLVRRPVLWWTGTSVILLSLAIGALLCNRAEGAFQGIGLLFSVVWLYGCGLLAILGVLDHWVTWHRRVQTATSDGAPSAVDDDGWGY
ncbi:MAG: hypothetical protein JNK12_02965 [Acidimicrobiales bacterium]|nr:hypothetical protein [Acidimicrobiales bacterium]